MQLFRRNEENKILTKEINTVRNGAGCRRFKRNAPSSRPCRIPEKGIKKLPGKARTVR